MKFMKKPNFVKISIILASFSLFLIMGSPVKAAPQISDIKISELNEGWAKITWTTNEDSTGYLVFGESPEKMTFSVGSMTLGRHHQADMTGLQKNKNYYFKIIANSPKNGQSETFVNFLDTDNMKDSRGAKFSDFKKLQTTNQSFSASFVTDEEVKIEVKYGTEIDNKNKTIRNNSYKIEHSISLKNLNTETKYFFEIIATDKDGNKTTYSNDFKTSSQAITEIKINNLIPRTYGDAPLMPEKALVSFETNLLATTEILYGTDPNKLTKTVKISTSPALNHQIFLSKLEPNTNYYYKLRVKSDLIKNTFLSQVYSFKTASLNQGYLNEHFQSGDKVKYKTTTYLIYNEVKVPIYNSNKARGLEGETKKIEEKYLAQYQERSPYYGVFHDGQVVKEKNKPTIYLIDGEYKKAIANWQVFTYLNYKAQDITIASATELKAYKDGATINHSKEITSLAHLNNTLAKSADSPVVYLLVNGKKLPFLSETAFKKAGYNFSQVKIQSNQFLNNLNEGQVII